MSPSVVQVYPSIAHDHDGDIHDHDGDVDDHDGDADDYAGAIDDGLYNSNSVARYKDRHSEDSHNHLMVAQ
jgi:hypothetical protein